MGSKRWMLDNGLGEVIQSRISNHSRFVDLFCGSAAVSWHVARNYAVPVLSCDLQEFCRVLSASVICRTDTLEHYWIENWINRANLRAQEHPLFMSACDLNLNCESKGISELSSVARTLSTDASTAITAAYGGHYFSPLQAIYFDSLHKSLPSRNPHRTAALAALIQAGSVCAASPGHTAQPFGPTNTAEPYLRNAWSQDVFKRVRQFATRLSSIGSKRKGVALTGDANKVALDVTDSDLVFIDPPYSSVHYSRFYHVLETIAIGKHVGVTGVGRYPPRELRPQSRYSLPSESISAFKELLNTIGTRRAGVIITFPAGSASNGLSGKQVTDIARNWFTIECVKVKSRFSTLGGNKRNRSARVRSEELVLSLSPK